MSEIIDCEYSIEGNGPALFLIHGIGAARNTWRKAMPLLSRHFKVISYDLRGHGVSPMSSGEFVLDDLVADLERLRETTGIEQAHFAGHSLGGMIGPAYALKYPDRVLSLGLLSTAAFRTEDDSEKVWNVVRLMEQNGIEQVLSNLTSRWFTDAFIEQNPNIISARLEQVINTDPDVFLNVFRIYAGTEMSPWINQIKQPSLILTGENDGGCNPQLNRQIHAAMSNSELVILPGYKHSLLLEAGEIVAEQLVRFIGSIR